VRSLFEYVVYDLDKQRIVDFRLKGWADRFLVLRTALYDDSEQSGSDSGSGTGSAQATVPTSGAASGETARMGHKSVVSLRDDRFCFSLPVCIESSLPSRSIRSTK